MNLEPLCNVEQSSMLKELGFDEETEYIYAYNEDAAWVTSRSDAFDLEYTKDVGDHIFNMYAPTISLAKNWLYEKYRIWITTDLACTIAGHHDKFVSYTNSVITVSEFVNNNPHQAESDCLTEVLKKLTHEKSNS